MSARSAVTLSNENGPSRSRPCQESRPAASGAQRPALCASTAQSSRTPPASSVRGGPDGLGELAQARQPLPGLLAAR